MNDNKRVSLMSPEERGTRLSHRLVRIVVGLTILGMLTLSCSLVDNLLASSNERPTDSIPVQPTVLQSTAIVMDSPMPAITLPPSPSPEPSAKPDPWLSVAGTWSGCLPDQPGEMVPLEACGQPRGSFITLYLLPACTPGEICGSYVKGAFESEYILLHLTLEQIQGGKVRMQAVAAADMFSWAETQVVLERAGDAIRIVEAAGEKYLLPVGCDPVIDHNVTIHCYEHVP